MSDEEFDVEIEAGVTSVLLGFSGKTANVNDLSVLGNHIGGTPVWFRDTAPPPALLQCTVCSKPAELLCQLSCPLPNKLYDRSLYVFSCSDPNCRRKEGSVFALKGIEKNEDVKIRIQSETATVDVSPPEESIGDSLFGSSGAASNPFAMNSVPSSQPSTTTTKSKKKKSKKKTLIDGKYACKLLDVEEEYLEPQDTDDLLKGVKVEEADPQGNAETSESKAVEINSDDAFMHFVEIVECNPDQVLRYEYGLAPLLYSSSDGVAERLKNLTTHTLEVQLMPHLISELETRDMIADGMEWGTIYVATANDDELPQLDENGVGYAKELVFVQWEERV